MVVDALHDFSCPVIRVGTLEVRLAQCPEEVQAAQNLRYRVFYEDMGAKASAEMQVQERDFDEYDEYADHLLVIDHQNCHPEVVGTYRLITRKTVEKTGHFYSAAEYDLSPILKDDLKILELGRSCIDAHARSGQVMTLLWRGLSAYMVRNNIDYSFGCASLPGTNPDKLQHQLSYLHHFHLAPPELRVRALAHRYVAMDIIPSEEIEKIRKEIQIPAMIKGYLRAGVFVGDGAVVDHEFNTTDVFILMPTHLITDRYYRHYYKGKSHSDFV